MRDQFVRASELAVQLRAFADGGHPRAAELHAVADEFEAIREAYLEDPPAVSELAFGNAWAKARGLWSLVEAQ